ncbi:hypothetical protein D3C75_1202750 [compost metagenome]
MDCQSLQHEVQDAHADHPVCWRRRRINPIAEMSLTQSNPREPLPVLDIFRFRGRSVLRRHVGQFSIRANKPGALHVVRRPQQLIVASLGAYEVCKHRKQLLTVG